MDGRFSTADACGKDKSRLWAEVIGATYFPLDLRFRDPDAFDGRLQRWGLGRSSLSRLTSGGLSYRRERRHLRDEHEEQYLVTVPMAADVSFGQRGATMRCRPGGLLIERGHEPYEFSHASANDLWVLKIGADALRGPFRDPDRHCGIAFDASSGAGGLFADLLRMLPRHLGAMGCAARETVEQQLVGLLGLATQGRAGDAANPSLRDAHRMRADAYIRRHLADFSLDPDRVARGCGISTRYLHALFSDGPSTVAQRIRALRLDACRADLVAPDSVRSIAEIAYAWGFSDQAHFSRLFKARFGEAPRDYRQSRKGRH